MPLACSASTWSFISEMSGDIDHRSAFAEQGRQLVADGFSPACGHQYQCVGFVKNRLNDFFL